MNLAAFVFAAALATSAHQQLADLFRRLVTVENPFAVAPRLVERVFPATQDADGIWRRYDGDGCFVELGPFEGRTPRKIVMMLHFSSREEAATWIDLVSPAIPVVPHPRLPFHRDGPFSYRGAMIVARRPIGLEVEFAEVGEKWRVTVTLVSGGPRVVLPIRSRSHTEPSYDVQPANATR